MSSIFLKRQHTLEGPTVTYLFVFSAIVDVYLVELLVDGQDALAPLHLLRVDVATYHGAEAEQGMAVHLSLLRCFLVLKLGQQRALHTEKRWLNTLCTYNRKSRDLDRKRVFCSFMQMVLPLVVIKC